MPSGRLKNDFDEVDEALSQGVDYQSELILRIRVTKKVTWI
jgi:hypothetical protein